MKKNTARTIVLLLVLCLALSTAASTAFAAKKLNEIVDTDHYPVEIDTSLSCNDAFAKGNSQYKKGQYATAKSYYLLALKKVQQSDVYYKGDVCNNLVLTMLQLEENETAYELCRFMLENKLAKNDQDLFGYMMNLLVCAHANGIPAAKELSDAMQKGYFRFKDLAAQKEKKPGKFTKLLTGLIYNVLYIDMESDAYAGAASYYYLPTDKFKSVSNNKLMQQLSKLAGGKAEPQKESKRKEINGKISTERYLHYIRDVLENANQWNKDTFGEKDPDINELLEYLEALTSQKK